MARLVTEGATERFEALATLAAMVVATTSLTVAFSSSLVWTTGKDVALATPEAC
ncbi:MAG: hypothetical protein JWM52_235 [Candidatus Saccharibacteria bacterium]|nr:hypothetical protein [Candidatus Saccharibacteria bacterium]